MTFTTWAQSSGGILQAHVVNCIVIALALTPLIVVALIALPRMLQDVQSIRRILHALFPLTQAAFISVQLYYALTTGDWAYAAVLICCSLACALIDMTLVKHLIASEQRDQQNDRLHLLDLQTEAQRQRMRELDKDTEGMRDDYRRFLRKLDDLEQMLQHGSAASQMEHSVQDAADALCAHTTRFCDNLAVDALLSMKMQEAQRNGIDLHCDAQVGKVTPLSDVELCAVFANLCDNALHACQGIHADEAGGATDGNGMDGDACSAAVERPWIRVRARIDMSHCMVSVTNPCATSPPRRFHHGGRFDSRGRFRRLTIPEHGWGLQILESIAAHHGGTFSSARVHDRWLALFSC
ncbi:ATPase [Bifidobacterium italicum]|uniref:ATPase n=1 Tax=Bifidobacterium italicum TaxID=1960968 RepID=A0A2A2EG09_9BIFI|nr:GHKL domain-containing protein [Bifidobacterium italicum]PAU67835.1 ATPase [Bifidobacterium italicum]